MSKRLRIAVLASGRGSNLAAIIAACANGTVDAEVVGVFSDKSGSGALVTAAAAGIPHHVLNARDFPSRLAFDTALFAAIDEAAPDLIVCAGFMRILSAELVAPRSQRLINIHPSLLPKYTGLHTHQRALDAGDTEHGASVHFVIAALDAGPVIAQTRIRIEAGDNAETLATRLLPAEHRLLIETIARFGRHRISHRDQRLCVDGIEQPAWQM